MTEYVCNYQLPSGRRCNRTSDHGGWHVFMKGGPMAAGASEVAPFTDEERAVSAEMERDHRIAAPGWVNLDDPAVRERLADEFMDLRLDGPWVSAEGFTYQEAARLYADRFLAALRGSDEEGAG